MLLFENLLGVRNIPSLETMFEQVRSSNGSKAKLNLIVEQVFFFVKFFEEPHRNP